MLMNFFRRKAVMLLTVLGISAPFIGMKMVGFYYYSSIIGCAAGFLCCILALILIMKRSDHDKKEGKV
ncbi:MULTISPECIES: hypothetical protein [Bacillus]|uniref:hypothetical protein n=1 Tax=Bacillus sp. SKDU12 TaxID=1337053 RepID=UPI001389ED98|nr:hypothetical protein BTW01_02060 [Bacillus sp. SKDU12]